MLDVKISIRNNVDIYSIYWSHVHISFKKVHLYFYNYMYSLHGTLVYENKYLFVVNVYIYSIIGRMVYLNLNDNHPKVIVSHQQKLFAYPIEIL